MIITLIIIISAYCIMLTVFIVAWLSIRTIKLSSIEKSISVIVAVRNESTNLRKLIETLRDQQYLNFEVIVVDDHSNDDSLSILESISWDKLRILKNTGFGKKAAIDLAINHSKSEIIACTDADCILNNKWLSSINQYFEDKRKVLGSGAVAFKPQKGLFALLQKIEFSSLIGSGAACIQLHYPTMCNGANIFYRKSAFHAVNGFAGNDHIPSGDDEFLMHKIHQKFKHGIGFLKHKDALVFTDSCESWQDFKQQRLRWASKWENYTSSTPKILALLILLVNLAFLASLIISLFTLSLNIALLALAKITFDYLFLSLVYRFSYNRFIPILPFLTLSLTYPLYVIYFGIRSRNKSYIWKDREHNNS